MNHKHSGGFVGFVRLPWAEYDRPSDYVFPEEAEILAAEELAQENDTHEEEDDGECYEGD